MALETKIILKMKMKMKMKKDDIIKINILKMLSKRLIPLALRGNTFKPFYNINHIKNMHE